MATESKSPAAQVAPAEPAEGEAATREAVTDGMVEAALNAVPDDPKIGGGSKVRIWLGRPPETNAIIMRAALEAALAQQAKPQQDQP